MSQNEYRKRLNAARAPFDSARAAWSTERTPDNWRMLCEAEAAYRRHAEALFEEFCAEAL